MGTDSHGTAPFFSQSATRDLVSLKIEKPYIRLKRNTGFYECSLCLAEFKGPATREGLAGEFAEHVRLKHKREPDLKSPARLLMGRKPNP